MSKRSYFRTRFDKQRVSGFETLLKLARHDNCQMFPEIWENLSWEMSVLVRSEILGLFVNTMTLEYKYSCRNMHSFPKEVQA